MAQLQQPFNAQAVDPTQGGGFQQLPLGDHPVIIVASEVKANSQNTGGMVVFDLQVIGGPSQGASGKWILNLYSSSDKARSIAETQLSALCHATGQFMISDTAQLHNQPFGVRVTAQDLTADQLVKQANGEKVTPFTQVSRVLMPDGSEIKAGGQAQAPAPAPQAPAPAPTAQAAWGPAAGAPAPAAAWGAGQQAQAPAQAPAPAAAWAQGAGGGKPAWGAK